MLNSLRRLYLYLVATAALVFTTFALEQFIERLLDRLTLDPRIYAYPNSGTVSQSIVLLAVAIVLAIPVGGLHWWLIRRDGATDPTARGDAVRAFFVTWVLLGYLSGAIGSAIAFIDSLGSTYGYYGNCGLSGCSQPSAYLPYYNTSALAYLITSLLGVGLLFAERRWTRDESANARGVTAVLYGLAQLGWLITALFGLAYFIENALDTAIQAYPICVYNGSPPTGICQYQPADLRYGVTWTIGGIVALTLVLWLARGMRTHIVQQVAAFLMANTAIIFVIVGVVRFVFLLMTQIAGTPGFTTLPFVAGLVDVQNYTATTPYYTYDPFTPQPFLAVLVAGLVGLAAIWLWFGGRATAGDVASRGSALVLFGLDLPLAFCFLYGLAGTLQYPLLHVFGATASASDRAGFYSHVGMLIVGLAWPPLAYALYRLSRGQMRGAGAVWRIYIVVVTAAGAIAALIGAAIALYNLIAGILGLNAFQGTQVGVQAGTIALVALGIALVHVYLWQRDSRERAAAQANQPAPAAPAEGASILEGVLAQVAAGTLSVGDASQELRARYHIH